MSAPAEMIGAGHRRAGKPDVPGQTDSFVRQRTARVPGAEPGQLIPSIRELTSTLCSASSEQLSDECQSIRSELLRGRSHEEPDVVVSGFALACEALRRSVGVTLYDVQLRAAIEMTRNRIVQMQTGEGKTFVGVTAACYLGMAGRGVHVMTPNTYLAERDQQIAAKVLAELSLTAGLLEERVDAVRKTPAYDCDVTYGTGHEFGFDYLRDQLTLRGENRLRLGTRLLRRLHERPDAPRMTMQRGLCFAIVDEADSVLIDDAGSPLVLSMSMQQEAPDAEAHRSALALSDRLEPETHYHLEPAIGLIALTEAGIQRCYDTDVVIPIRQLVRPWTEYVVQSLRAKLLFRRNVHFVVDDGEVRIVDESTGRIFEDRSWQDGLHQAVEAREGVTITAEKEAIAQITRQRFFRLYSHLCGMTGTAIGCDQELRHVYRREVSEIPLRVPSQRRMLPARYFATAAAKWQAIAEDVSRIHSTSQPILIGTRSIADSELLSRHLRDRAIGHSLLNGLQDASEAEIIARAGIRNAVTIATNLAGRGTDIHLSDDVRQLGGLHVIVAECQTSGRMDRQLIGRCARQGDPGSAQIFVSAEDILLKHHGPWLSEAIRREANSADEARSDFSPMLRRIQAAAERGQFVARMQLLQRDQTRDKLFRSG